MSGFRTIESVGHCLTCGWCCEDRDHPRVGSAEAVQHKHELPNHEVVIDREQSRSVPAPQRAPAPSRDRES